MIYTKFTVDLACSLMMIIATTTIADSYNSPYPLRVTDEQDNLWELPQTPNSTSGFQKMPKTQWQQYQGRAVENNNRGSKFITPEILESIKQQQTQSQLMPENKQGPLSPHSFRGLHQSPKTQWQQYKGRTVEKNNRGAQFITPEILESIKQQQTRQQLMPGQLNQNYGYPPSGRRFTNHSY